MFLKFLKLVLLIFISYQTPLYSKSATFNDFNSRDLSNYFSGIVAFENQNNSEALKFFNLSKVLIDKHDNYLKRYINSLVLDNKVSQAINVLNNKANKSNSDFYEAYLILIIDSLKKNNFKNANDYLKQSLKFQDEDRINLVLFETLRQYIYTFENKKILNNKKDFGNLSFIAETFQRCYLGDEKTSSFFLNLVNSQDGEYSRYIFFYLNYLIDNKKINEARLVVNQFDYIDSTLLLSQSKNWIENNNFSKFEKVFSCKNHNHVVGEFLFLISNLYSSQENFEKSNFFLNLSNYLNPKFKFNLSLVAENYYLNKQYNKVKKILKNFNKEDEAFYWFRVKKESQILVNERNYDYGIKYIVSKFSKIENPNSKIIFDLANFYKNAKKFEKAIEYYTQIILKLDDESLIKSDLLFRRGGSYERLGKFDKSDKDFFHSLDINPNNAHVLNYLAYSWLEREYKIDEAMKMLQTAYELRNDDPYIIDSIGWAYFLIDNYTEAEKYIKRAVELMPDDPIVNDHYGDILWKLNRKIQARYFWNNVLTFDDTEKDMINKINIKIIDGL